MRWRLTGELRSPTLSPLHRYGTTSWPSTDFTGTGTPQHLRKLRTDVPPASELAFPGCKPVRLPREGTSNSTTGGWSSGTGPPKPPGSASPTARTTRSRGGALPSLVERIAQVRGFAHHLLRLDGPDGAQRGGLAVAHLAGGPVGVPASRTDAVAGGGGDGGGGARFAGRGAGGGPHDGRVPGEAAAVRGVGVPGGVGGGAELSGGEPTEAPARGADDSRAGGGACTGSLRRAGRFRDGVRRSCTWRSASGVRSERTCAVLERVGAVLGAREGTGPDDDPMLRSLRRQSRAEGKIVGKVIGKMEGMAEGERKGRTEGRAEGRGGDSGEDGAPAPALARVGGLRGVPDRIRLFAASSVDTVFRGSGRLQGTRRSSLPHCARRASRAVLRAQRIDSPRRRLPRSLPCSGPSRQPAVLAARTFRVDPSGRPRVPLVRRGSNILSPHNPPFSAETTGTPDSPSPPGTRTPPRREMPGSRRARRAGTWIPTSTRP